MRFRAKMWRGNAKRQPPRYSAETSDFIKALGEAGHCPETHAIVEKQFEPDDKGTGSPEEPDCNCGKWFLSLVIK